MSLVGDAMDTDEADPMDLHQRDKTEMENKAAQGQGAGDVCAAMASIMSGLSVRVHVAALAPYDNSAMASLASEKKPVHGQVARLRKEDQQLMEDVCTDACGCGCLCSVWPAACGGGSTSPGRRRLLHQIVNNNHDVYQTPPPIRLLHYDSPFGHPDGGHRTHANNSSSSSSSGSGSGGFMSNVSTPRASSPSPLGIRTRSWSIAAADATWDSAASIARTVSSSF